MSRRASEKIYKDVELARTEKTDKKYLILSISDFIGG
jgi:hypothetical protein